MKHLPPFRTVSRKQIDRVKSSCVGMSGVRSSRRSGSRSEDIFPTVVDTEVPRY